jgi:hypothetical protein
VLLIPVVTIVSIWKVFVKAGRPGWASLIPFYNIYVLLEIADYPGWWFLLLCIPLLNLIMGPVIFISLAKQFGKPWPFGLGLFLLPFVFFPILAFSDATYTREQSA